MIPKMLQNSPYFMKKTLLKSCSLSMARFYAFLGSMYVANNHYAMHSSGKVPDLEHDPDLEHLLQIWVQI